jgi:hypothetical protein
MAHDAEDLDPWMPAADRAAATRHVGRHIRISNLGFQGAQERRQIAAVADRRPNLCASIRIERLVRAV